MISAPPPDGPGRRGLLIDFGGVLTTSVFASFAAFEQTEGLDQLAVARLLRDDPRAAKLLVGLETGGAADAVFENELAVLLGVSPAGLIKRLLGGTRPERAMTDAVRQLRRAGVRTALVSNSWGAASYPEGLLNDLFDAVVISGQVGLRKPDPEIYRLAAEKVALDPAECVFVDDLPTNLSPAARLGMGVIRHITPAATIAELAGIFGIELTVTDLGTAQPR
ncbi:HAD family phosphatase [Actinocrinis sp.]|uniref:HAD family hydrolase n=1 Tax=Actinocrinis sp. TaxID=1920516 RepID=UPI002BFECB4C|nr:HAD family phosphatase [Actinocrinis sp.]HXR73990.1 HAD family phosphatase [Actinocrinis sp.]